MTTCMHITTTKLRKCVDTDAAWLFFGQPACSISALAYHYLVPIWRVASTAITGKLVLCAAALIVQGHLDVGILALAPL